MDKIDHPKVVGKAGVSVRLDRLAPTNPKNQEGCKEQTKAIAKKLASGGEKPEEFLALLKHFGDKVMLSAVEQFERNLKFQGKPPAQGGLGVETDRSKWEEQTKQLLQSAAEIIQQVFQTQYPQKKLEKLKDPEKLKRGIWQLFKQATPQLRHAMDVVFTTAKTKGKKNRLEVMLSQEVGDTIDQLFDKQKLEEAFNAKNLDEFAQKIGQAVKKDNEGKIQKSVYRIIRTTQKALGKEKDTDLPEVLKFLQQPPPQEAPQKVTEGDKTRIGKQPKPENFPLSLFGMVLQGIRKTQQEWEKKKKEKEDEENPITIQSGWDF